MLSTNIKAETHSAHQELEGKVVRRLKAIRSNEDYADLLKYFYAYFSAIENAIATYINESVIPDWANRRHANAIATDIQELGFSVNDLPPVVVPTISNTLQALGALYVMEGSIMGGPYIVQMLKKGGLQNGFSFFSGYGENTGQMWATFTAILNNAASTETQQQEVIGAADETFSNFSKIFNVEKVV
ncbi:biliverdin-producing heme oxygenase [Mucilaginibacter sp. JRF]|uniref:biliverdin-producing heme oxygenase n=1 Tax=Mucilaginibacter sp. JRF TaxID=2780088 RepID=UPI00187DE0D4|nr:biliverdin-producing heme oxygenase [Mucilaginibacter sp. JRF]MBE9586190.1 biliverdin-producing heme oxygenase [Mucilaginibacter sp. JRF]